MATAQVAYEHIPAPETEWLGKVKHCLLDLGSPDPSADIEAMGDYVHNAEAAGVSPGMVAAIVYATTRHMHPVVGVGVALPAVAAEERLYRVEYVSKGKTHRVFVEASDPGTALTKAQADAESRGTPIDNRHQIRTTPERKVRLIAAEERPSKPGYYAVAPNGKIVGGPYTARHEAAPAAQAVNGYVQYEAGEEAKLGIAGESAPALAAEAPRPRDQSDIDAALHRDPLYRKLAAKFWKAEPGSPASIKLEADLVRRREQLLTDPEFKVAETTLAHPVMKVTGAAEAKFRKAKVHPGALDPTPLSWSQDETGDWVAKSQRTGASYLIIGPAGGNKMWDLRGRGGMLSELGGGGQLGVDPDPELLKLDAAKSDGVAYYDSTHAAEPPCGCKEACGHRQSHPEDQPVEGNILAAEAPVGKRKPLRWHRNDVGYYADGFMGKYVIVKQTPDRRHDIRPYKLTLGDRQIQTFDGKTEAQDYAQAWDDIVPNVPGEITTGSKVGPVLLNGGKFIDGCPSWLTIRKDQEKIGQCVTRMGVVNDAADVYRILGPEIGNMDQEVFVIVLLDVKGQGRGLVEIARGQRSKVIVEPSEGLRYVLATGASSFWVAHCHPSGDAEPSAADKRLTKAFQKATQQAVKDHILPEGVEFCGHIVIGSGEYADAETGKVTRVKS